MRRLALALSVSLCTAFGAFAAESLPILKGNAVVHSDTLRLGDLFENAGAKSDVAIAYAPQPGKRVVLDARWLQNAAQTNGLNWQPSSPYDRTMVERASTQIPRDQIEMELLAALAVEGVPPKADIELATRDLQIYIPEEAPATIAVRDLSYDPRTKRFQATIESPANSPSAVRSRVAGRVFATTQIPVLARPLNRGQTITDKDIEWQEVRGEAIRRDVITDIDQLVGQSPRRSLRAGMPVQSSDVQTPIAVTRGSLVTMVLKTDAMTLTSQGKALENGSVGDTIRITNTQSNHTVEAKVEGPNMVSVIPTNRALAN